MKRVIYLTIIILLIGSCENETGNNKKEVITDKILSKLTEDTLLNNEVVIISEGDFKVYYPKDELAEFHKIFAEFTEFETPIPPDEAYDKFMKDEPVDDEEDFRHYFASEVGHDDFYILYFYFLKKRTGSNKFNTEREALYSIFNTINSLNRELSFGGTLYGHKTSRIYGYAEYAVYEYSIKNYTENNSNFIEQKKEFINDLKAYIIKMEENNDITIGEINKKERIDQLMNHTDSLSEEISNYFYLKQAELFQEIYY